MNGDIEFTDDEIREELDRLGYQNVPEEKLLEFKKDLMKLITSERSKNTSMNSSGDDRSVHRDLGQSSPEPADDSDIVHGNFTNHGSQWLGGAQQGQFKEDWHYRGRASSAPKEREVRVPGSYSLYELPASPLEEEGDRNNCGGNEPPRPGSSRSNLSSLRGKRKTVRKTSDGKKRIDESTCSSEIDTGGIFEIYEMIKDMAMRDCECDKAKAAGPETEPPYRIANGCNPTPSVIISKKARPHNRDIVRSRPGDRLMMYQKSWKKQPPVGSESRIDLKKQVHARLLKKDEIQLDRKVYIPNNYVVPTSKIRTALRWKVRHALENFEMPPQGVYHDM